MREATIRLGIIGLNHGLELLRRVGRLEGVQVVAACAPSWRKYSNILDEAGVCGFGCPQDMMARGDLDGVILAPPTPILAQTAMACARAGIPLLVEKPMACTVGEGISLLEECLAYKAPILVGYHRRYSVPVLALKDQLRSGRLGRILGVQCVWAVRKPDAYFQQPWRIIPNGGGPLMINICHEIDLLRFLLGEIREVSACLSDAGRGNQVEDSGVVSLVFQDGAMASLFFSDATPSPCSYEATVHENPRIHPMEGNCYSFFGTRGSITFPGLEIFRYQDELSGNWLHELDAMKMSVGAEDPLLAELHHFIDVIRHGEAPRVGGPEGLMNLIVVEAIKLAWLEHRSVRLEEIIGTLNPAFVAT